MKHARRFLRSRTTAYGLRWCAALDECTIAEETFVARQTGGAL